MSLVKQFPEFNASVILEFSMIELTGIQHHKVLTRTRNFKKHFGYDLAEFSLDEILEIQRKLTERLSFIKHPSVIDKSLFFCFCSDVEKVEASYKLMCDNKVKNTLKKLDENPILRRLGSLEIRKEYEGESFDQDKYDSFIQNHRKKSRRCIEYYIEGGLSNEEAIIARSKSQIKFSLESCIEKFGETEGRKKWQERQDKWQQSLNDKPKEEIERINNSKSWRFESKFNDKSSGYFYVLLLANGDIKIGITSKEIPELRYSEESWKDAELMFVIKSSGKIVASVEKLMKIYFRERVILKSQQIYEQFGASETIRGSDIEEISKMANRICDALSS